MAIHGYEADDVIGTLAQAGAAARTPARSSSRATRTSTSSSGPASSLLNPGRGGPAAVDEVWVDESNAAERLGVPPSQVVDYLALVGDSSDNVPGVKGIGEKGAQKLLAEYGNLDTILARAAEVTAKRTREALLAQADAARLSKELVTIQRNVPVELDVADLVLREPDREGADPDPHRARVLLAGAEDGSAGRGGGRRGDGRAAGASWRRAHRASRKSP